MHGDGARDFLHLLSTFRNPDSPSRAEPNHLSVSNGKLAWRCSKAAGPQASPVAQYKRHAPSPAGLLDFQPEPEDDLPLDAFDRELLAQIQNGNPDGEEETQFHEEQPPERNIYGVQYRSRPFQSPMPRANSRFFQNSTPTPVRTSFQTQGSSSSELGQFSSPLLAAPGQRRTDRLAKKDVHGDSEPRWPSFAPVNPSSQTGSILPVSPAKPQEEIQLSHAPPMIQGIRLVSTHELPDRFRSAFPFPVFNAIQSKSFAHIYQGDDNFVLSAPTGSGKTVIMELAICRLVTTLKDCRFKVVYQAPTKSLCSERFRDWQAKFSCLDLQCAELTGDTDHSQMRNVQNASIIITTPEKWDSMTRKWKDHMKLMQLVKLFLIDEVHILKETRGATLEAVVSRMKSVGSNVRFVALSATVPNSEDIATWLGKDATNQHLPAHRERFGEEFRPVKLQKFVYGYQSNGNDFAFDKVCETKLPEVIAKHSLKKPIMIFCCTRNSAIATAKNLSKLWSSTNSPNRLWNGPSKTVSIQNPDLRGTVSCGVAFHHAGLDSGDRHAVETGFLEGHISVICCTSTLAVGVNLPCHLVIIKNTVSWQDNACKEYVDLEMMQMLGRAGRPQFDDSAVAVILTRRERVGHYERLVAGVEPLESCLHLNLIDHLNAEIGLGTITDVESAIKWLAGTFFFVRLRKNPSHYKLKEGANRTDEEEMLQQICEKDIKLLQECSLVTPERPLKSTEFGDAMARYYVKFETMRLFLSLPPKAKMSEILSALAQAEEFREIRLKAGEKSLYKEINKGNGIKFPIKVDIALAAHKISLLIQSELGAEDIPTGDQYQKHRLSFQQDKALVFSHVNRLIRCILDCQLALKDSISTRHALELARSLGARVWDNSALQMKQLEQVGIVAVRKLANAGINSIESLEATEPHRIDMILSKNPPFGAKLLGKVADFPKPRVSLKLIGKETKPGKPVKVKFRADIGFINEKIPTYFHRRPVYVCFLAETSDGQLFDFRRISASKLQNGHEILLTAEVTNQYQHLTCYVMCDEIAGTLRQAELKPDIPPSCFLGQQGGRNDTHETHKTPAGSTGRRTHALKNGGRSSKETDEFDDGIDDGDLIAAAEDMDYVSIDDFGFDESKPRTGKQVSSKSRSSGAKVSSLPEHGPDEPIQLENGKWACNHKCKDKTTCKHFCCRDGLDKPPRPNKKQTSLALAEISNPSSKVSHKGKESRNNPKTSSKPSTSKHETKARVDTTHPSRTKTVSSNKKASRAKSNSSEKGTDARQSVLSYSVSKHANSYSSKDQFHPSFLIEEAAVPANYSSSDYGSGSMDDYPSPTTLLKAAEASRDKEPAKNASADDDIGQGGGSQHDVADQQPIFAIDEHLDEDIFSIYSDGSPSTSATKNEYNGSIFSAAKTVTTQESPYEPPAIGIFTLPEDEPPVDVSSDSLFFKGCGNTPLKRRIKDPEEYECISVKKQKLGNEPDHNITSLELDLNGGIGETTEKNDFQQAEENDIWEGIDPALLEEFKDIVEFF